MIPAKNGKAKATAPAFVPPTPPPTCRDPDPGPRTALVRMIGIGGTGVVTVSQILGMAAHLDGLEHQLGLDQTGLAQKGGPVVSRRAASPTSRSTAPTAPRPGSVDAYLGFDLLGGAEARNLRTASPERTTAVVSTERRPRPVPSSPTRRSSMPDIDLQLDRIERHTRKDRNVLLDAQALSQALFHDHMPANAIVLGAAFQRGLLPVSQAAIEQAFRLNGAGVETEPRRVRLGPRGRSRDPDAIARVDARAGAGRRRSTRSSTLRERDLVAYQNAATPSATAASSRRSARGRARRARRRRSRRRSRATSTS